MSLVLVLSGGQKADTMQGMRVIKVCLGRWISPSSCQAVTAVGLALSTVAAALDTPHVFSKGPYLQAPGADSMTIKWESMTNYEGVVRFGTDGQLDQKLDSISPRMMTGVSTSYITNRSLIRTNSHTTTKTNVVSRPATNSFYLYTATLPNLRPGVEYTYRVELGGVRTKPRRFKTLGGEREKVRFIAYGDSRSNPRIHAELGRRFRDHAPDFILHTGDLVAKGKDYGLWSREFFRPLAGVIDQVPFFSTIGNHEEDGTNYLAYFHLPGRERWYSFDVGPVHVVALDYHFEDATGGQFKFAREDLMSSQASWKIVLLHYPVFNIGGHSTGWGHAHYLSLFHQTKVDLVLGGHSHLYERFRPVAPESAKDAWPITCITTGGGGASLYGGFDHPALVVHQTAYHYLAFEATPDTLEAKAIRKDGKVLDTFQMKKADGKLPADYLAQVYPEESLKLFFDVAPSLAGKAAAIPATTTPAKVMLTLLPRQRSAQPAELEVILTPESSRYYELENKPLRVTTPPNGVTNTVWVSVRATGQKKITGEKDRDLSPLLVFQATVWSAEGATVAYGGNTKRSKAAEEAAKKL